MTATKFLVVLLLLSVTTISCSNSQVMSAEELKSFINDNLKPGDPSEEIEAFLDSQGWPYAFDDFVQRYQAHYPDGDVNKPHLIKAVAILIYVDESRAFQRVVVEEVFTG